MKVIILLILASVPHPTSPLSTPHFPARLLSQFQSKAKRPEAKVWSILCHLPLESIMTWTFFSSSLLFTQFSFGELLTCPIFRHVFEDFPIMALTDD